MAGLGCCVSARSGSGHSTAIFGFGRSELGGVPEGLAEFGYVGEVDIGIALGAQAFKVRCSLCRYV